MSNAPKLALGESRREALGNLKIKMVHHEQTPKNEPPVSHHVFGCYYLKFNRRFTFLYWTLFDYQWVKVI
jgi:hypothetical protein